MPRIQSLDGAVAFVDPQSRIYTIDLPSLQFEQSVVAFGLALSYSISGVSAAGADDYVIYLVNSGSNTVFIDSFDVQADAATTVWLDQVSGTPTYTSPTTETPTNKRLGDPTDAGLTVVSDTDITGLTQQGALFFERCAVANTRYRLNTVSGILLLPSFALALRSSNPAATLTFDVDVSILQL